MVEGGDDGTFLEVVVVVLKKLSCGIFPFSLVVLGDSGQ